VGTYPFSATASGGAPALQLVYADSLGIDHTGAADVSAAVRAKQTALGTAPYVLVFGEGTYLMNSAFISLGPDQYIRGQGKFATQWTWSAAGWLVNIVEPGTFNGGHRAGGISGGSIVGPQGSGGVGGVEFAGLQSMQMDDMGFFGLDAGAVKGYKFGSVDYAEEYVFSRLTVSECGATSGWVFGFNGTSFDYGHINGTVVVEANIDIVSVQAGAQLQGLELHLQGNVHGGASNTGAVVAIERGNAGGTGYATNMNMLVSMEADNAGAGTVGPYLLWMGSSNAASQFSGHGVFTIFNAGAAPQGGVAVGGTTNASFLPASFSGITLDTSGLAVQAGDALAVMGGLVQTPTNASNFGVPSGGNIFPQFGNVIGLTLNSGVNSAFVLNAQNGFVRQIEILIRQPASGGAGTAAWPANVKWPAGAAPTLSVTNGFVDKIRMTYIPFTGFWYGELVGVHYS